MNTENNIGNLEEIITNEYLFYSINNLQNLFSIYIKNNSFINETIDTNSFINETIDSFTTLPLNFHTEHKFLLQLEELNNILLESESILPPPGLEKKYLTVHENKPIIMSCTSNPPGIAGEANFSLQL